MDLKDKDLKRNGSWKTIKETSLDKEETKLIIERLKDRFSARPLIQEGEEQDYLISYLDLLNELKLNPDNSDTEKKQ